MRAGIYVRISLDMAGEGLGVTRQTEDCQRKATDLGWDVVETYTDNDRSALKDRPAFTRMLHDLEQGHIGAIIAWHPDRLYRRVADLATLVEACKRTNAQIATVQAGDLDLTTPTGRLTAGLVAQVAMYEVEHKSERWSRSWRQQRERGLPARTGTRLYGYTRDGDLIPHEAAVARRMAADVINGVPILAICRALDADGITASRGRPWQTATLKQYLCNPRIAGWSTLKGEIVGEGQWEPILDRETWELVRSILQARTRAYAPRRSLLNGLVFCGKPDCGTRLITGSHGRGRRCYRCPDRPGLRGCGGISIMADPVEEVVETYARTRLADPDVRARVAELRREPTRAQGELADIELRIRELEQQLDRPGTPVETLMRAIDRARARQEELSRAVADRAGSAVVPVGGAWPEDLRRRRALVELVVDRIDVTPSVRRGRVEFDPRRVQITPR